MGRFINYRTEKIIACILVVAIILTITPKVSIAASGVLAIELLSNKDSVQIGEEFIYTIKYSYSSGENNANNVIIEDYIPEHLEVVEVIDSSDIQSVNVAGNRVRYIFKSPLTAGTTGTVKVKVKFKNGIKPNVSQVSNQATIDGELPDGTLLSKTSNLVTVSLKEPIINWSVAKDKTLPQDTPAVGSNVTYKISLTGNSLVGGLNLNNLKVTDTFDENAVFVSASGSVSSQVGNKVIWDIPSLNVGQKLELSLTLNYPSEFYSITPEENKKTSVINKVVVEAEQFGEILTPLNASTNHGFTSPQYNLYNFSKDCREGVTGYDEYSFGQEAEFIIRHIKNTGNVGLKDVTLVDYIPEGFKLKRIVTDRYINTDSSIKVFYKTKSDSTESEWILHRDNLSPNQVNEVDFTSILLQGNERLSAIKIYYGEVKLGFELKYLLRIYGDITATIGSSITNTAELSATDGTNPIPTKTDSETIRVIEQKPWVVANKKSLNGNKHFEEEFIEYLLTVSNHKYATGNFQNPVIVEQLPDELDKNEFVYSGWVDTNGMYHSASTEGGPLFSEYELDGITYYKWSFNGVTLLPQQEVAVKIKAPIKVGTETGFLNNTMYAFTSLSNDFKSSNKQEDINNIDLNGITTQYVSNTEKTFVKFKGALKSQKWVKGELDIDWSFYGDPVEFAHGKTLPGGIADYRLKVLNTGSNGPISNIVIIDVLPYINDTELVSGQARQSEWRPYLVNDIKFCEGYSEPSNFKIWYAVEPDEGSWIMPDLRQVDDPENKSSYNSGWTQTIPDDITRVRAIKLDFGDLELQSGEKIELTWPMRAPVGAPTEIIAWNSFVYGATYPDEYEGNLVEEPFLKAEPQKVGFKVIDPNIYRANLGNFIWEDLNKNGLQEDGEHGINGVLVELYKKNLSDVYEKIKYTRSGDSHPGGLYNGEPGYYLFPNLEAGVYKIKYTLPSGYEDYLLTTYDVSLDNELNSDVDPAKAVIETDDIIIAGSPTIDDNLNVDLGLYKKATISGVVWNDRNINGIKELSSSINEPLIENVAVELYHNGVKFRDTVTDSNGFYSFNLLDPGIYQVKFIKTSNYVFSPKNATTNDKNSDADENTGFTDNIIIQSGDSYDAIDSGMYLAEIGDFIWEDINANGVQDDGENGIANVTVKLYLGTDLKSTTQTDAAGKFKFIDLDPATNYIIEISKPNNYDSYTSLKSGSDITKDSDVTSLNRIIVPEIVAGERNYTLDAGYFKYAKLGNLVWNDLDHDGLQDTDESGVKIDDNSLTLKGPNGYQSTKSNSNSGSYSFSDLRPGSYELEVAIPDDYIITKQVPGALNYNSDLNEFGKVENIVLSSGQNRDDIDIGVHKGLIGNYVWEDMNGDGIQNDGASGLENVKVILHDITNGNTQTTYTSSSGQYLFTDLPPANYRVQFELDSVVYKSTVKTSSSNGSDVNSDFYTDEFTLQKGETKNDIDAGFWRPSTIGDFVWYEKDGNGQQGGTDENGVNNVEVILYKGSTEIARTKTGESSVPNGLALLEGEYLFDNLSPGSYKLQFILPSNFSGFIDKDKGSDNTDCDVFNEGANKGYTDEFLVLSGSANINKDAGLYVKSIIGDTVWVDVNANGLQDSDESVYLDSKTITIEAYRFDELEQVTYVENGHYSFANLRPGEYYLKAILPEGYLLTEDNVTEANDNSSNDSDYNQQTYKTKVFQVDSMTDNDIWDMGVYKVNKIGNDVWYDTNGNNKQDIGEPKIPNIKVYLIDENNNISSTTTNDDGIYSFNNLYAGDYKVAIKQSDLKNINGKDYLITKSNVGDNDNIDSDIVLGSDDFLTTNIYSLITDTYNDSVDIGLYEPASIGDYVFRDMNANGIQDAGDKPLNGVVSLKLYDSDTSEFLMAQTPLNGVYKFSDLDAGNYYIEVSTSLQVSPKNSTGSDINNDSDLNVSTKQTDIINISNGQQITNIDIGIYEYAKVGNLVWNDINGNGKKDSSESGVANVEVRISGNGINHTTTTDNLGFYEFNNLVPGDYTIQVVLPNEYDKFTLKNRATTSTDSDVNEAGYTDTFTLTSGQTKYDIDAGVYKYASLGDTIWFDDNVNGQQDDIAISVTGITLNLYKLNGLTETLVDSIATTTGDYLFSSLSPGNYIIKATLPSGYYFTKMNIGDNLSDSDTSDLGVTETVSLSSGENNNTVDIGIYKGNSIGDKVWHDINGNGIQDSSEQGVQNIKVNLYRNDIKVQSVFTDINGMYSFNNLITGEYKVGVESSDLQGYIVTKANESDDNLDSDLNSLTKKTSSYSLLSNTNINNVDIGLYKYAKLGNYVWLDTNGDGIQGESAIEPPMNNVVVKLVDENNNKIEAKTDINGLYLFENIAPGDYRVEFYPLPGYEFTKVVNTSFGNKANSSGVAVYSIDSNETYLELDAGLMKYAMIGDLVWLDSNENGIKDSNEKGMANQTVKLISESGDSKTTTTDENGHYQFVNVHPGNYQIQFTASGNYRFTKSEGDISSNSNSDASPQTGITQMFSIVSNQHLTNIDAGLVLMPNEELKIGEGSIGDYIWHDENGDGIQNSNEKGIPNVEVTLFPKSAEKISTYTDSKGYYQFNQLPDGAYSLIVKEPEGYKTTIRNSGSNKDKDSDANRNGLIEFIGLYNSDKISNIDIGLVGNALIGDFVWLDENENGLQDKNESGFEGVKLNLYSVNNELIKSTVSNNEGYYSFNDLAPGKYFIEVISPQGYIVTKKINGRDLTNSDANENNNTDIINLKPNQKYKLIDFGLIKEKYTAQISGCIWADCSDDNIRDAFEQGVSNIKVKLLQDGNVISEAASDIDGYYLFSNLPEGEYNIDILLDNNISISKLFTSNKITLTKNEKVTNIDIPLVKYGDTSGVIYDEETNEPLANCKVEVYNSKGRLVTTLETNSAGEYSIKGISQCMNIKLRVKKQGYKSKEVDLGKSTGKKVVSRLTRVKSEKHSILPKTGDNIYNLLIFGITLLLISLLLFRHTKKYK